jgi:hypothetical protein
MKALDKHEHGGEDVSSALFTPASRPVQAQLAAPGIIGLTTPRYFNPSSSLMPRKQQKGNPSTTYSLLTVDDGTTGSLDVR